VRAAGIPREAKSSKLEKKKKGSELHRVNRTPFSRSVCWDVAMVVERGRKNAGVARRRLAATGRERSRGGQPPMGNPCTQTLIACAKGRVTHKQLNSITV